MASDSIVYAFSLLAMARADNKDSLERVVVIFYRRGELFILCLCPDKSGKFLFFAAGALWK